VLEITQSHDNAAGRRAPARARMRILVLTSLVVGLAVVASAFAAMAKADIVGPITFEPSQGYHPGDINGQQGWQKIGPYDVQVSSIAAFPAASGYGFGSQALRLSDAVTSGSFGDQTFSPGLVSPAGEFPSKPHFDAGFLIGTTQSTVQAGLHMSVSPDDGNGSRMSYLRFEDQANGVHVYFDDASDPGPFGTQAEFSDIPIATLSRTRSHLVVFSIDFKNGPGNDVVKIYIDGTKRITGTTWEDYYRYDPEQVGNGNQVPDVDKLLFREGGAPDPLNLGKGFLVDYVTLASSTSLSKNDGGDDNHGNHEHSHHQGD
jgi:hypothetical protein